MMSNHVDKLMLIERADFRPHNLTEPLAYHDKTLAQKTGCQIIKPVTSPSVRLPQRSSPHVSVLFLIASSSFSLHSNLRTGLGRTPCSTASQRSRLPTLKQKSQLNLVKSVTKSANSGSLPCLPGAGNLASIAWPRSVAFPSLCATNSDVPGCDRVTSQGGSLTDAGAPPASCDTELLGTGDAMRENGS